MKNLIQPKTSTKIYFLLGQAQGRAKNKELKKILTALEQEIIKLKILPF